MVFVSKPDDANPFGSLLAKDPRSEPPKRVWENVPSSVQAQGLWACEGCGKTGLARDAGVAKIDADNHLDQDPECNGTIKVYKLKQTHVLPAMGDDA